MKAICIVSICFVALAIFSGCGIFSNIASRLDLLNKEYAEEMKSNLTLSKALLECFTEKDMDGLKVLLCERTRELIDIDVQIIAAFDILNGKIISFNEQKLSSYEGKSTEYGKTIRLERKWSILDIETENNENYEIYVHVYYVYENDKKREGIAKLIITRSSDGKEVTIGYGWPDYNYEGQDKAIEIMKAFDEKNFNGLKSLFCAETLAIPDIDNKIKSAIDFYEGVANDGWYKPIFGQESYDGNRDWQCSVSDEATISNGEPTSIFISVLITNIKTDVGKRYEINACFFLINTDNETQEGISQIIITRNDGEKHVIGERIEN